MNGSRRRVKAAIRPLSSEHHHRGPAGRRNSTLNKPGSTWEAVLYTLRQILDVPSTVVLLVFGFIIPEVRDWITRIGMGKEFDPARDVQSMEGKVVLVTGGMVPATQS